MPWPVHISKTNQATILPATERRGAMNGFPETSTQPYGEPAGACGEELSARYAAIVNSEQLSWHTQHRKVRLLGSGGQGVVFLTERRGTDRFSLPVALKIFSPRQYHDVGDYEADMGRIAHTAARVALIQHDNVLAIHDFIEEAGIRIMEMEWVD